MGRVLAVNNTASTPTTVPIIGASGVTIADIFTAVLPPSRDFDYVKVTATVEILTTGTSAAQAVNFDLRTNSAANSVAANESFVHTTRAVIDRNAHTYTTILPGVNQGGTVKFQFSAVAADAQTTVTGLNFEVEAI